MMIQNIFQMTGTDTYKWLPKLKSDFVFWSAACVELPHRSNIR